MRIISNLSGFVICVIVALLLYGLGTPQAVAQDGSREYIPFVEESKVWYCGYWHPDESFPITPEDPSGIGIDCIFTIHGDTQINGKEYKKVYCQFEEYYDDNEQHYYCAVREEACQVFIVEAGETEEKLIYDFSHPKEVILLTYNDCKIGRTSGDRRHDFLPGQLEYTVCNLVGNELDYSNNSSVWIDGVGACLYNPFALEFNSNNPKFGKVINVVTCMKDGKYIFNMEWMTEPISKLDICRISSQNQFKVYNLEGCQLTQNLQRGINIVQTQDGKVRKIVMK